ncbi:MAG: phosphatase PAP2 family protein, partial [Acetobacteraceae bacterium]
SISRRARRRNDARVRASSVSLALTQFLANFADQAVVLPLAFAIFCALAALSWTRGALAWGAAIGATFALMLALKLAAFACGPPALRSPSGHTAAAAIVLGGLAVVFGRGARGRAVLLAAAAGATLIGLSRLALGVHTAPEVALGGLVGIAGALALSRLAGPPPGRLRLGWLAAVAVSVVVLFHGWHLDAEPRIHLAAYALHLCRGR